MVRIVLQVVMLGWAVCGCNAALAKVEVEAVQHASMGALLLAKVSEDIGAGDYEVMLKGIRDNPGRYAQKIVLLDSIGGGVAEAIRMGRLLREAGFDALVPSTGVCQGSCVYLLAAGKKRTVRGYVGIHRPYFAAGDSAQARLGAARAVVSPAAYFKEMGVLPGLADAIYSTAPQRMRVLSAVELARYRLN